MYLSIRTIELKKLKIGIWCSQKLIWEILTPVTETFTPETPRALAEQPTSPNNRHVETLHFFHFSFQTYIVRSPCLCSGYVKHKNDLIRVRKKGHVLAWNARFVATDRAGKCQTFGQKYSHFQVSHLHYSLADILSKISVMLPQTIFFFKKVPMSPWKTFSGFTPVDVEMPSPTVVSHLQSSPQKMSSSVATNQLENVPLSR